MANYKSKPKLDTQKTEENKKTLERLEIIAQKAMAKSKPAKSHLTENKHPQRDFFIADVFDTASFRDDIASMEHPFFALRAGDTRERVYAHNGVKILVASIAKYGLATIFDKDVWIYAISKLVHAINDNQPISRTIHFTIYDFLISTNRTVSGRDYERAKDALKRLAGTRITTSLENDTYREASGFGLIDSWRIVEEKQGRMIRAEITLPNWLYRSITTMKVAKISPHYFRIRKPIDRRIYELARKHCADKKEFPIGLALIHKKTGSTASIREFRRSVKSLADSNELPDYEVLFEVGSDKVIFKNRNTFDVIINSFALKQGAGQSYFQITLAELHKKTGGKREFIPFKGAIKVLAQQNSMTNYEIFFKPDADLVIFKNRDFRD